MKHHAIIIGIGLFLCLFGIQFGLEYGTWLPDGEIEFALKIGQTKSLNPEFFVNPHVYTYILTFLYVILYLVFRFQGLDLALYSTVDAVPPDARLWLYLLPRLFSALCTILSALVIYRLALRLGKTRAALLSSLAFLTTMTFVTYAHFEGRYALSVLLLLIPLFTLLRFVETRERKWLLFSSLLIGLSISTKYLNAFLIFPLAIALLFVYKKDITLHLKRGAISCALIIFGFLFGTPFALLDYPTFIRDIKFIFAVKDSAGYNGLWSELPALYYFPDVLAHEFGLPLFLALLCLSAYAVYTCCKKPKPARLFITAASISFILPYTLMLGSGHFFTTRYLIPTQVFLITLASVGIAALFDRKKTQAITAVLCGVLLLSGAYSFSANLAMANDSRYTAREWIVQNIEPGATIDHFYRSAKFIPPLSDRYNFRLLTTASERGTDQDESKFLAWLANYSQNPGDYIILSSFEYGAYLPDEDKYFSGAMNLGHLPNYPKRTQFYTDLLSGKLGYERIYEYKYTPHPFMPHPNFVNPTIVVMKRKISQ